jgi:uncharacterized alkaline shock family protein YloU
VNVDAEAVAAAAARCPGVVGLASGSQVEIATYLPRQRVHGVRIRDDVVEVHIIATSGTVLPELAEAVRRAVAAVAPGRAVDVYVEDIDLSPPVATVPPAAGVAS